MADDTNLFQSQEAMKQWINELRDPTVYLYRGINSPANQGQRLGAWWTTDPYYALRYAGHKGEMYHAPIKQSQLKQLAHDASIESEFQNYIFPQDPPGLRPVTPQEISRLRQHQTTTPSPVGGPLVKSPPNPIDVGRSIFGPLMPIPGQTALRLTPITEGGPVIPPSSHGAQDDVAAPQVKQVVPVVPKPSKED